jgi:Ser/Thr protein kinase RdoA (MazF antagonist)
VALAERAAAQLDAAVASASQSGGGGSPLPRQACHGDLNENNVLVSSDRRAVVGVIDWGDASRCWRATEVAIAATYMLLLAADDDGDAGSDDAAVSTSMTAAARHVIDGYLDAGGALTAAEAAVLPSLICGRIALSLINGATAAAAAPENAEYTLRTQRPGWRALEVFVGGGGGMEENGGETALLSLLPERLLRGLKAEASV